MREVLVIDLLTRYEICTELQLYTNHDRSDETDPASRSIDRSGRSYRSCRYDRLYISLILIYVYHIIDSIDRTLPPTCAERSTYKLSRAAQKSDFCMFFRRFWTGVMCALPLAWWRVGADSVQATGKTTSKLADSDVI